MDDGAVLGLAVPWPVYNVPFLWEALKSLPRAEETRHSSSRPWGASALRSIMGKTLWRRATFRWETPCFSCPETTVTASCPGRKIGEKDRMTDEALRFGQKLAEGRPVGTTDRSCPPHSFYLPPEALAVEIHGQKVSPRRAGTEVHPVRTMSPALPHEQYRDE